MSTRVFRATYDGEVLHLHEPLPVAPGTEVRVVVDTPELDVGEEKDEPGSFFRFAESLNLEGPPDWSVRIGRPMFGFEWRGGKFHDYDDPRDV